MKKYEMLTTPFDHQQRVFDVSKDRLEHAVFWEMGLGKTKLTLDVIGHLYCEEKITGALIIAPKGVYQNWFYDEIPRHLGLDNYFYGLYKSAPRAADKVEMAEMLQSREMLTICIMNVEAFSGKKGYEYAGAFLKKHRSIIVVDESTAIKTWKAARTKALCRLARLAPYKRILTGTPITQSPLDLFSQCQFLKQGLLGFPTWSAFKSYYAEITIMRMGTRSFSKITGYRNLEELQDSIKPFASRLTKKDCLTLPEKLYTKRYVDLTVEQRRAYDQLKEIAVLEFNSNLVTSSSALTTLVKLQQIVCGHCMSDDKESFDIPSNRLSVLQAVIEERAGSKIIIFANFQRDIQLVAASLREKYGATSVVEYYGKTSDHDRKVAIQRFNNDDTCRFFVSSSAGSKGITLVASNVTIYYSNGYNLETRLQSEDRNHRIGQTLPVTYVDLIARKTTDEVVLAALTRKKNLADSVVDALRDIVFS